MHLYFMIYVNHGASFDIHSKKVSTFSLRKFPFLLSDHTQCIHTCMCTLARTARPTWMAKAMASSGTSATSFHTGLSARSCMSKLPPDVFMKCMQLLGWCIRKGYTTASCILTPHIYVFVGSRRRCKEPPVTRAACNGKEARRSRYCAPGRGGCGKKAYMFAKMCKNKHCAPSLKSHRKTCMFVATVYIARHSWSMLLVGCFVKCVCEIFHHCLHRCSMQFHVEALHYKLTPKEQRMKIMAEHKEYRRSKKNKGTKRAQLDAQCHFANISITWCFWCRPCFAGISL